MHVFGNTVPVMDSWKSRDFVLKVFNCKSIYIYTYIYMYMYMYGESTFSHIINWHTDLGLKGAGVSENSIEI